MSIPIDPADVLSRYNYLDVQALGRRIGVELPNAVLKEQTSCGYPCHRWDYALHELGHLVLALPAGAPEPLLGFKSKCLEDATDPIDRSHPEHEGWVRFQRALDEKRWSFGNAWVQNLSVWSVVPTEWTVQSWCFEVAKALGWLPEDMAEAMLGDDYDGPGYALRMFWGSGSMELTERWSLQGNSRETLKSWTLRRQHALQVQRLKDYGVDFAAGQLVPTARPRRIGPYIEIVDPLGRVRRRLPGTWAPEGAPLWWALWNWFDVYGDLPPGLSQESFSYVECWQDEALEWTAKLNTALVGHANRQRRRLKELLQAASHDFLPSAG